MPITTSPPPLTEPQLRALALVLHQAIRHGQLVIACDEPSGESVSADDWSAVVDQIEFEGESTPRLAVRLGISCEDVAGLLPEPPIGA
jgi:hypothetical protein